MGSEEVLMSITKKLANYYAGFLPEPIPPTDLIRENLHDELPAPSPQCRSHLAWMCHQLTHAGPWSVGKANRWLGFIQGALWILGVFSIDELRQHIIQTKEEKKDRLTNAAE